MILNKDCFCSLVKLNCLNCKCLEGLWLVLYDC